MSLTHTTAVRNSLSDLVVDALDTGTPAAEMVIATTSTRTLCLIDLATPSTFGAAATGTATMQGTPSGTATSAGTASIFIMRDGADLEIFRGAVAASGSDLNLSSTTIAISDKIQITSFTYSSSV